MARAKLGKETREPRPRPEKKAEPGKKGELRGGSPGLGGGAQTSLARSRLGLPEGLPAAPLQQEDRSMLHLWETQFQEFLKDSVFEQQVLEGLAPWEDPRAFLASFEKVAVTCCWPRREWVTRLLPALSKGAEEAFVALAAQDREDFWKVKAAILRREAAEREQQRQAFRRFGFQEASGPREVLARLRELSCQWLRAERSSKEQLLELLLLEQLLSILPRDMRSWVKERFPETCLEAVALAEEFLGRLQATARRGEQQELDAAAVQPEVASTQTPARGESEQHIQPSLQPSRGYKRSIVSKMKKLPWGHDGEVNLPAVFPGRANIVFPYRWKQERSSTPQRRYSKRLRKSHPPIQVEMTPWPSRKVKRKLKEQPPLAPQTHKGQGRRCEVCGKNFNGSASFLRHHMRHTGEKRYECCFCGKGFCWRSDLVRHECQHAGKKPHECSYCGEGFDRKWLREKHQKIHLQSKRNL